ncbi:MAG: response regulator [Candidatus Latescibacteria bacterium]|jgi:DNA-binding NtrC family response regulator|nr:hypothetical protein [Gemmatimonadaceae bacterium]MDP7450400.1 response regulator [Candidatus Latescibacterota bacterium]HJP34072.1 response regulator [Candidatus Latescibacterota bacterium]|tara:strand:- start:1770 stop:2141 length:372 start_codon:yes stop_codon:yes gene_type:complete
MGATVLVVEDDEQVRALVVTILKKHDFVVIEATNAWQALAALQRPPVDLVILDLRMPYSISGSDLIGTMKDLDQEIPVIIFSGWTEDLDDELPSFVKAVLPKPVRVEQFIETVNAALSKAEAN